MTPSRPPRRVVVLAAAALVLTACSATNPIQTDRPYAAADGVQVALGEVRLENLLAVTLAKGGPGALSGAAANDGGTDAVVTLTVGEESTELDVPAGGSVLFGTGSDVGERIDLNSVSTAPGGLLDVTVAVDIAGTTSVQVPVVDGSQPPYDTVLAG